MYPKIRVLIGDNDFNWGTQCANMLDSSRFDIYVTEHNSLEILNKIHHFRPDIIILNAQMKHLSAIGMMEAIRYMDHYFPEFIVIHSQHNLHLEQDILRHGAYCYLEKPFTYSFICDYILEIADAKAEKSEHPLPSYEETISQILRDLKIPVNIKGFRYLRTALLKCLFQPALLESITKGLYPVIAEEYSTNILCVERSIRNAIDHAWKDCDREVLLKYFGTIDRKPSNSQFIFTIADQLRIHFRIDQQNNYGI